MNTKATVFLIFIVSGVLLLGAIFFLREDGKQITVPIIPDTKKSSISGREDPTERFLYEFQRVKNPITGKIPENIRERELQFSKNLPAVESLRKPDVAQDYTWSSRGPVNIGGRTRALGIDVSDDNIILAGGVSGGMYRSTDQGQTWTNTTPPYFLHSISCLAQDTRPGKTNTWYYGSGEGIGNSASNHGAAYFGGNGVFKSTNNGLTWILLTSTATDDPQTTWLNDIIWNVAIDPSNTTQSEVYYAMGGIIRRSISGGGGWSNVLGASSPYSYYTDIAVTYSGIAYAAMSDEGSDAGLWRSPDGVAWTEITPEGWPDAYRRTVIGIAPSDEDIVYFLAYTPGYGFQNNMGTPDDDSDDEWHSLWRYDDSDGTWEDRSANLPNFGDEVQSFYSQTGYDLVIKVHPDDEDIVFIGGTCLYRSTDGFATTTNTTWIGGYATTATQGNYPVYSNHYVDQHALAFLPSDVLISSNDGGVSKTTNNRATTVSWTSLNNGYITTQFYTVAIDPTTNGDNAILGGMQDRGTYRTISSSPTAAWSQDLSGDGAFCAITPGHATTYVSAQRGVIYKIAWDAGWNDTGWTRVDPVGDFDYLFINPFVLDPNDYAIMYLAAGDRIWRNNNLNGIPLTSSTTQTSANWEELSNTEVPSGQITALGVSSEPAHWLYYGTDDGQVYLIQDAHSGDPTPQDIWSGKGFPTDAYVNCIMVDPDNANKAIVVFSNYEVQSIFYTTNAGNTWVHSSGNLEQYPDGSGNGPSCRWAAMVHSETGPVYFVGTSTGLYSTTNLDGTSTVWVQEGASSIGNVVVDMIAARQADGRVVIGTHGAGAFSSSVPTNVEDGTPPIPTRYALHQNYPNPFNPTTTIEYSLPISQRVTLKVYNMQGREVASMDEGLKPAGRHTITFDATGLTTGTYFYRITAGPFSEVKKLTLMK